MEGQPIISVTRARDGYNDLTLHTLHRRNSWGRSAMTNKRRDWTPDNTARTSLRSDADRDLRRLSARQRQKLAASAVLHREYSRWSGVQCGADSFVAGLLQQLGFPPDADGMVAGLVLGPDLIAGCECEGLSTA